MRASAHVRRRLRLVLAVSLVSAVPLVWAPAGAQGSPTLVLTPTSGAPTTPLTVLGEGFAAGERVGVAMDGLRLRTTVATVAGTFTVQVTIPANASPGKHEVAAVGPIDRAQATLEVSTPWPQSGFSAAGNRYNPMETTLTTRNVGNLRPTWTFITGGAVAAPAVDGRYLYAESSDGDVYSLDAASGRRRWSTTIDFPNNVEPSPTAAGPFVYATAAKGGVVYALDASSGAIIWQSAPLQYVSLDSAPTLDSNLLFVGSTYGSVEAFRADTGAHVWSFGTADRVDGAPSVAGGVVYAATEGGKLYAVDESAGTLLWSVAVGGAVSSTPAVGNGMVFVATGAGLLAVNAVSGAVLWSVLGTEPMTGVALANGTVYSSSSYGAVFAVVATTGAERWAFTTNSRLGGAPAVANNVVYQPEGDGSVYGINALTGAQLWQGTGAGWVSGGVTVTNGTVYVSGSSDGTIHAYDLSSMWPVAGFDPAGSRFNPYANTIDASNISELQADWATSGGYSVEGPPVFDGNHIFVTAGSLEALDPITGAVAWTASEPFNLSAPAVGDAMVFVSGSDSRLHAFVAATGSPRWTAATGQNLYSSVPVVDGHTVFLASSYPNGANQVVAADTATGTVKWEVALPENVEDVPAIVGNVLYLTCDDGNLYALNVKDGTQRFVSPIGAYGVSSPAVSRGIVYVGSWTGVLHAVDASSGTSRWTFTAQGAIAASPAVAYGIVYVGSEDGRVYALDAKSGAKLWTFVTNGPVVASAAVANGVVFVASNDGSLYALDAYLGTELWHFATGGSPQGSAAVAGGRVSAILGGGRTYSFGLP